MKNERKMTAIYLNEDERATLEALAEAADQTMSAYVRTLIRQAANGREALKVLRKARAVEYAQ